MISEELRNAIDALKWRLKQGESTSQDVDRVVARVYAAGIIKGVDQCEKAIVRDHTISDETYGNLRSIERSAEKTAEKDLL